MKWVVSFLVFYLVYEIVQVFWPSKVKLCAGLTVGFFVGTVIPMKVLYVFILAFLIWQITLAWIRKYMWEHTTGIVREERILTKPPQKGEFYYSAAYWFLSACEVYYLLIDFKTENSHAVRQTKHYTRNRSSKKRYDIDSEIKVAYNRNDPDKFIIVGEYWKCYLVDYIIAAIYLAVRLFIEYCI